MKSLFTKFMLALLLTACAQQITLAQVTGCNTSRYLTNVFPSATKTTVQFGQNINTSGFQQTFYMDIYQPDGDTAQKRPTIVFAHGGSFIFGTRDDMAATCLDFAKKGYVTATIDYRLWNILAGTPDSFQMLDVVAKAIGDMKASVRQLRLDAYSTNTFRIDTNNIFVGGLSAGAIAALHVAMMGPNDSIAPYLKSKIVANGGWEGSTGNAANATHSSKVRGVVSLSGALYRKEIMDSNDPPFIAIQGTADAIVPFNRGLAAGIITMEGSNLMDQRATAVGVSHHFTAVPGGGHTDIYDLPQFSTSLTSFYLNGLLFLKNLMCNPTATDETQPFDSQIAIYPNPSGAAMVFDLKTEHPCDVFLYDMMGRCVKNMQQVSGTLTLEKSEIGSGTFIAHFIAQNKTTSTSRKIIFE